MQKITDPDLLKSLNSASPKGGARVIGGKVTDPDLLAKLNEGSSPKVSSSGVVQGLARIPGDIRGMLRDTADYATKAITGEGQFDPAIAERGELGDNLEGTTLGQSAKIAGAYATSPDPVAVADIAEKTLPGAKRKIDQYDNQIIEWNGKDYYINRPGASSSDAYKLLADTISYYPAAKISSTLASLWARIGVAIPTNFLTSISQDVAAEALGSEQGVDVPRASMSAFGGSFGEVLAPTVVAGWRALFGNPRFYRGGRLTPEGARMAEQAGLKPGDMGQAEQQIFASNLGYAADRYGAEAANVAGGRTQSGEFGVKLSRGQRTQDPAQLRREDLALQGASTDAAQAAMRNADLEQKAAMAGAADDIATELNPQATTGGVRDAAEALQQRVIQRRDAAKQEAGTAYKEVSASKDQPVFSNQSVIDMRNQITKKFRENYGFNYDAKLQPRVKKVIDLMQKFTKAKINRRGKNFPVMLPELERFRRSINKQIGAATPEEKSMLISVKRDFDSYMDTAIETSIVGGDAEVIKQLKRARGLWANYSKTFGVNGRGDAGGKFVEKILNPNTSPEEVIKGVFGISRAYPSNGPTIIRKLQEAIGKEGMDEVREMGWQTTVNKAISQTVDGANRSLSPQKFVSEFQKSMNENLTAMKLLYSPDELAKMRRFATLAERLVRERVNPSGTVAGLSTIVRDFAKQYLTFSAFMSGGVSAGIGTRVGLDAAESVAGRFKANRMLNPKDPRSRMPLVPAIGATLGAGSTNVPQVPVERD